MHTKATTQTVCVDFDCSDVFFVQSALCSLKETVTLRDGKKKEKKKVMPAPPAESNRNDFLIKTVFMH